MSEVPPGGVEQIEEEVETEERSFASLLRTLDIDSRLLGMIAALLVIWIGIHIMSGGTFLTPRNLWNLSVQTAAVAVMATGMVLIIVTRNIDLSVGSMLAFIGMAMALLQAEILPDIIGFGHPLMWILALIAGIILGAIVGGFQGFIVAYVGVPSFIVTLGGLLIWRGAAWWMASGRTIAPMDETYQLLGGGSRGNIGGGWSWIIGIIGVIGIILMMINRRRQRLTFGFTVRPLWADIAIGVVSTGVVLGGIGYLNRYYLPELLAKARLAEAGLVWPDGGINISQGLAVPVLIAIGATLLMTFVATRLTFGRYVFAIGGNPEAAELGGIRTRWTIVKAFALMGMLVAVGAAIQTARLNAAVSGLGQLTELYVIAAAVIGGTSLGGGIGTIPGAILGALVMQSLQSGMVLLGVDAPLQDIVVGVVLVIAVAIDSFYRKRSV